MSGADAPVHTPDAGPDGGHRFFVPGIYASSFLQGIIPDIGRPSEQRVYHEETWIRRPLLS